MQIFSNKIYFLYIVALCDFYNLFTYMTNTTSYSSQCGCEEIGLAVQADSDILTVSKNIIKTYMRALNILQDGCPFQSVL